MCIKGKQEKWHDQRFTEERCKVARGRKSVLPCGLYLLSTLTREDNRWRVSIECLSRGHGGMAFVIEGTSGAAWCS